MHSQVSDVLYITCLNSIIYNYKSSRALQLATHSWIVTNVYFTRGPKLAKGCQNQFLRIDQVLWVQFIAIDSYNLYASEHSQLHKASLCNKCCIMVHRRIKGYRQCYKSYVTWLTTDTGSGLLAINFLVTQHIFSANMCELSGRLTL